MKVQIVKKLKPEPVEVMELTEKIDYSNNIIVAKRKTCNHHFILVSVTSDKISFEINRSCSWFTFNGNRMSKFNHFQNKYSAIHYLLDRGFEIYSFGSKKELGEFLLEGK